MNPSDSRSRTAAAESLATSAGSKKKTEEPQIAKAEEILTFACFVQNRAKIKMRERRK